MSHSCEVSGGLRSTETERRRWGRGWGRGKGSQCLVGTVSVWEDEKVLHDGGVCPTM